MKYFATLKRIANYGLLIGFFALAPLGAQSASAASDYDDVVTVSDELYVTCYDNSTSTWGDPINVSKQWYSILAKVNTDREYLDYTTDRVNGITQLDTLIASGSGYAISQLDDNAGHNYGYRVRFNINANDFAYFDTINGTDKRLVTNNVAGSFVVTCNDNKWSLDGSYGTALQGISYTIATKSNDSSGEYLKPFISTMPMYIPSGYEGATIPDLYEELPPIPDLTGLLSFAYEVDRHHVKLWSTVPTPPMDNTKMLCSWTAANNTDGVILDTLGSCSNMQEFDVATFTTEVGGMPHDLLIVTMRILYDINDDGLILDGEELELLTENLKIDGTTYSGNKGGTWQNDTRVDWYACFTDEVPFIHIGSCLANFSVMADALENNKINFTGWNVKNEIAGQTDCRNLAIIGDWLLLTNKQVCAQIPSLVRTIVTSFIIVAFSLMGLRWVMNREHDI